MQRPPLPPPRLAMVLDLDHTLVHSVDARVVFNKRASSSHFEDLYFLHDLDMWTKVRPHALEFVKLLKREFDGDLHVYTMGTRPYAAAVCKLLDPDGTLFVTVVSKDDFAWNPQHVGPKAKCLRGRLEAASTMIVDDSPEAWWSHHAANVISIPRYFFLPFYGSRFDVEDSELLSVLDVVRLIKDEHVFSERDVRASIASVRSRILSDCRVAFVGGEPPGDLVRAAANLGAAVTPSPDERTSHIVVVDEPPPRRRASDDDVLVVHQGWLRECLREWRRTDEMHWKCI